MLKKLKILFFLSLLLGAGYAWFLYKSRLTLITPYPYYVSKTDWESKKSAENSNVLIIGDRMGAALEKFTPEVVDNLSKDLKEPIKIFNWAKDKEGLHRSLAKLKSLKQLPKIIIYHGASQELLEKKFLLKDKKVFEENLKRFNNEKILSLVITLPKLSRFLYKRPSKYFILKDFKEDLTNYNAPQKQARLEMSLMLFQLELEELITFVKEKESTLILMTSPINLDSSPQEVCFNSQTDTIAIEQMDIEKALKKGQAKEVYQDIKKLSEQTPANAKSFYLLGQTNKQLGRFQQAKQQLIKAAAFDCKHWRVSPIHNILIRDISSEKNTLLLDFDQILNQEYGKNELFVHDLFPQNIYYNRIMKKLGGMIKNIYKI